MQISKLLNILRTKIALGIFITFVFFAGATLAFLLLGRTPSKESPVPVNFPLEDFEHGSEIEEPLEEMKGFTKKESLPDGATKYIFNNPSYPINDNSQKRESIMIADSENNVIFQRTLTDPSFPIKLTDYTEPYGPPKQVHKGSYHYGSDSNTYVYPELRLAFIGNPQTGEVFEQHIFSGLSTEEYIQKYGEDIIEK